MGQFQYPIENIDSDKVISNGDTPIEPVIASQYPEQDEAFTIKDTDTTPGIPYLCIETEEPPTLIIERSNETTYECGPSEFFGSHPDPL